MSWYVQVSNQSQNNIVLEHPGKMGHRYGNSGVKYPDRTDDENKETVGHILDNGTGYSSREL